MSEPFASGSTRTDGAPVGQNDWLVAEKYQQFLVDPSSVEPSWRALFSGADAAPAPPVIAVPPAPAPAAAVTNGSVATAPAPALEAAPVTAPAPSAPNGPVPATSGDEPVALRGAPAMLARNMTTSLGVPTATSVHPLPATVLDANRKVLNDHLARTTGQKISFTHLVAYAVVRGLRQVSVLNSHYESDIDANGAAGVVHHRHVGLGLAIDLERRDGSRSLVVPVLKQADTLGFADFVAAYEDLVRRARDNHLTPDDFAGATITLTNPGTLGTTQSVPRLMEGQGAIIGVGAIDYPAEFAATDADTLVVLGVAKVLTLTSTYDHRIIQGAESGLYLRYLHELLIGEHGFFDEIFAALGVRSAPVRLGRDRPPLQASARAESVTDARIAALVERYRRFGHVASDLDPLATEPPAVPPELEPGAVGLSALDQPRRFSLAGLGGLAGRREATLSELVATLGTVYTGTIGAEFMHAATEAERAFFIDALEAPVRGLDAATQLQILSALQRSESFERFLHARYVGQRRFSLEGGESAIVFFDAALGEAARAGVSEALVAMAHRGRLNVLANIVGKPLEAIFAEFEQNIDPASVDGSGDVKYHKGGGGTWTNPSGESLTVIMTSNPSHLEAVDPVVVGRARAREDVLGDVDRTKVLPLLVHGDASMAGQGVVAETFNLSLVDGYFVGGSIHLVINNQLGFTTKASDARSTRYASDVAKIVDAPILHVNGDDPEAVWRCAELAVAYRARFHKDVVVDLICYRLHGHNEGDDPTYTQPVLYEQIEHHPSVRAKYTDTLVERHTTSAEAAEASLDACVRSLADALATTRRTPMPHLETPPVRAPSEVPSLSSVDRVDRTLLDALAAELHSAPAGFTIHPKLERQLTQRLELYRSGEVDWALGEALALGSLLVEGTGVRLIGQDTRRGTFSQRHAVLVDPSDGSEHTPLQHLAARGPAGTEPARFEIYDSVLSEYAGLGFEYGYTLGDPSTLVAWEAQFGDFANGAQIVVDNFLVAAEEKWGVLSGVVMLLPHGYEGQGPEHSSARLERYLQLATGANLSVVQPTSAGQYFHLLRAQAHASPRRPLIVIAPKSLLRAPKSRSSVAELADGSFHAVLDDARLDDAGRATASKVICCSGRIFTDLVDRSAARAAETGGTPVPVIRLEQLAPWPGTDLASVLADYPLLDEVVFVQDEPENMGPWPYVAPRLDTLGSGRFRVRRFARPPAGSPATGSHLVHDAELHALLDESLGALAKGTN